MPSAECDLTELLDRLCLDVCRRVPELTHIDPQRVLFALSRSRAEGAHGTYARIVPLRFADGSREASRHRGRLQEIWRLPLLRHQERDILYLIQIMVPRFFRLSHHQKLATVLHELYHISERCDGDLRRFPGRKYAHGPSRKTFQRRVEELLDAYLATAPDPILLGRLDFTETDWAAGRVRVIGLQVPLPRAQLVARERR